MAEASRGSPVGWSDRALVAAGGLLDSEFFAELEVFAVLRLSGTSGAPDLVVPLLDHFDADVVDRVVTFHATSLGRLTRIRSVGRCLWLNGLSGSWTPPCRLQEIRRSFAGRGGVRGKNGVERGDAATGAILSAQQ